MTVTVATQIESDRGSDFSSLVRTIRAAGLLDRQPVAYGVRIGLTMGFYLATWAAVVLLGDSWLQTITAAVMGVAFTQVAFLGHDGGHQQIFESRRRNDLFGQIVANVLLGLSFGWWVGKHNRHHANPNKEDHDPDIGDGVLVFTTGQVAAKTGRLGRAVIARQAWLFFPLLTLEGLQLHLASVLALRRGSERSCRGGSRLTEASLLVVHWTVYLGGLAVLMSPAKVIVFVAIHQAVWGLYMGCSFAPNHKGMPTIGAEEDVDYLRRQVLTSRNVRGARSTDLLLGGLNYQIEHHLFPNMPRASLRRAQPIVRAHCAQLDISYCETTLIGSYVAALRHLNALGAPLRRPASIVDGPANRAER